MTSHVTSADGTKIAFDRLGEGPAVIVISGLLCDRQTTQPLAEQLAQQFCVINYDRRGRGESTDTAPYAVQREVEDIAALIADVGGHASVYAHSSGAGLALAAAASGLPITKLVLHEPPYSADDEESQQAAREVAENVRAALMQDRPADAIRVFLAAAGKPPARIAATIIDPRMQGLASTMVYDHEVMGDFSGGAIPEDLVRAIRVPTLVIAGGESPDFFREIASRIVELLPDGRLSILEGQDHGAPADVVAPVVAQFLAS
jgi:pimeloyl-ACP methyl ester carboxylesterase